MKSTEKAKILILQAIDSIKKCDLSKDVILTTQGITEEQLNRYHRELLSMLNEIESGNISSYHQQHTWMGHAIVDGWPLTHPLGEVIATAEDAYESAGK